MSAFYHGKFVWVFAVCLIILRYSCTGQSKSPSLAELVNAAKNHMPSLLQKKAMVNAARSNITDIRHSFLPNAFIGDQVNIGSDNSTPGSYLSFGLIPSTSSGLHSSNNYQPATGNIALFQTMYELEDFGLKKASIDRSRSYADMSQADLDKETYLLEWQTCKLYFDIFKTQLQAGIDLENIRRYEAVYKVIQALTGSGIKAGADSSLAMAELSKSKITFNQTNGQVSQLRMEMAYLTGLPLQNLMVDSLQYTHFEQTWATLGKGISLDSSSNPVIQYYQSWKFYNQQTENFVKKQFLPKLYLTGTAWGRGSSIDYTNNYKGLSEGLGYQRFNYLVGATLLYDVFDVVHRRDKLSTSHFNTMASDYDLQQQQLNLQNIGNQADVAIQTSLKNLLEAPVQIRASLDTYHQKTAQYKAGIINLIDLTNASFVLYRSQSDYVQILGNWFLATLDKAGATGNLDSFIQSIK